MEPERVVLFDGVCNLCAGLVAFIIRRDRRHRFHFAALQSEVARQLLTDAGHRGSPPDSVVLIEGGGYAEGSTAVLRILRGLGLPWSLLYAAIAVPKQVRERVYRFISTHRYGWFGRRQRCLVPTPAVRARFLDAPAGSSTAAGIPAR